MVAPSEDLRDGDLVARLMSGDEAAFAEVVAAYTPVMLHVARGHVATNASAEEVVQDAWLAVIRSLGSFQGRSSLRTWVVSITLNLARRRGTHDSRVVPWSSLVDDGDGPSVDPSRFRGPHDPYAGGWAVDGVPTSWAAWTPEQHALQEEAREVLGAALSHLPDRQRVVVTLRDVDGLTCDEVCATLGITAGNQRVLLHRGRSALRQLLEDHAVHAEVGT